MATLTNKASGKYNFQGADITTESNIVNFNVVTNQLSIVKSLTPTGGIKGTLIHFTLMLRALTDLTNVTITDLLATYGFAYVPGSVKISGVAQPGLDPNAGMVINVLAGGVDIPLTFDATVI